MLYGWCARASVFVLKQYVSLHLCVIVYVCLSAVGSDWGLGPFLLSDWRTDLKSTAEALCVPVSNAWPLIQGVSTCRPCAFSSSPCGLVTDKATPLGLLFTVFIVIPNCKNIASIICDHLKRFHAMWLFLQALAHVFQHDYSNMWDAIHWYHLSHVLLWQSCITF